jgi:hypothetical protein
VFRLEVLRGGDRLEGVGVDCRMILEWILGKYDRRLWAGFVWLEIGTGGGPL